MPQPKGQPGGGPAEDRPSRSPCAGAACSVFSVIWRELLAESRRPLLLWMRVGVAAVFFVLLDVALNAPGTVNATCRDLFPWLHQMLLVVSLFAGPLIIVDELSRERRERTLELLLLTPLATASVLHGKNAAYAVRTGVLVVATLPVVMFTLLFGGVSGEEWVLMVLVHGMALTVSLPAGLLAAGWARTWATSMAVAIALLVAGCVVVAFGVFACFQRWIGSQAPELWPAPESAAAWVVGAARLMSDADGSWGRTLSHVSVPLREAWAWMFGAAGLVTLAGAVLAAALARSLLVRSLRQGGAMRPEAEEAPSRLGGIGQRVSPAVRRRWLRGNPLCWLMRYRGEVRRVRWAAVMGIGAGQWLVQARPLFRGEWLAAEAGMAAALALFTALAAAGSFRQEREEGAWEMLVVTPLRPRDFLWGRIQGLWWQFGPAWATWVAGMFLAQPFFVRDEDIFAMAGWGVAMALSLPGIGIEAAFHFKTYAKAALATTGGGVVASGVVLWTGFAEWSLPELGTLAALIPVGLALLCAPGFELRLRQRRNGSSISQRDRHRLG